MTRVLLKLGPTALVLGCGLLGYWQGSATQAAEQAAEQAAQAVPTVTVDVARLKAGTAVLTRDSVLRSYAASPPPTATVPPPGPGSAAAGGSWVIHVAPAPGTDVERQGGTMVQCLPGSAMGAPGQGVGLCIDPQWAAPGSGVPVARRDARMR